MSYLEDKKMSGRTKSAILLLVFFLICMGTSFYLSRYKLVIYPIEGPSMEPAVQDLDKVLVYRTQNVKHGDVVIIESEVFDKVLIKRVIGVAGDTIEIKYNETEQYFEIWRNNKLLKEDYIKEKITSPTYNETMIVVPKGHFYYLGDNRNISGDCHTQSTTENVSLIVGKVIMKYRGFRMKFKLAVSA